MPVSPVALSTSDTDMTLGPPMLQVQQPEPRRRVDPPLVAREDRGLLAIQEALGRLEADILRLHTLVESRSLEGRCRRIWAWCRRVFHV